MINTAAEVLNRMIPMEIGPRRPGDASITIADNSKLLERFGENFKYSDLETIIKTGVSQI
jgi:UDP-glucose 4-epimerase